MFWKVYAVVYLVLAAETLPRTLGRLPNVPAIDLVDALVFTPIAIAALWSMAYRHISLPKNAWKIALFASVFWRAIVVGNALLFGGVVAKFQADVGTVGARFGVAPAPAAVFALTALAGVVAFFLTYPPLMALYRNAYGNESLLKLMSPGPMRSRQTVA